MFLRFRVVSRSRFHPEAANSLRFRALDTFPLEGPALGWSGVMSRIIKEPFAPRRRRPMIGYLGAWSRKWSWLDSAVVQVEKLAGTSPEDVCIMVLLVCLLVTTLILPLIVL